MSQTSDIRAYLNTGRPLTALQALTMFNCFRLAARINEIKAHNGEGSILTEMVTINGKRVARYHKVRKLR